MNVVEIFSSIQGEGLYVGSRQLFVRFGGCNLNCRYCDTPESRQLASFGQWEMTPGRRDFREVPNPVGEPQLTQHINALLQKAHHSVSLTGGEPLLQADALGRILPLLKGVIYLETNGTLPEALTQVLPFVQIISMDMKFPSVTGQEYWREHRAFLHAAAGREVFVKLVITSQTSTDEIAEALSIVAAENWRIPVILQPVTPNGGCAGIAPENMLMLQEKALEQLADVRVIPQTHKFMGQL